MQPDKPNNYWQNDPSNMGTNNTPEMYTPEPNTDDNTTEVANPNPNPNPITAPVSNNEPIHWAASEYIHEDKNWLWFVSLIIVAILFIIADMMFLKSYTFSFLVVVMVVSLLIYSRRAPKLINYALSGEQGLYIGERLYHFSEFKAFGLIVDHDQHSIMLIPTKRFSPGVSVYFPDEAGEKIVDILGARLPMEKLKLDVIDIIVRKLRL
ncbi:MAG: hypothetical protein WCJ36_03700 [Candidatus Saccharibacteria bacterium]